MRNKERVFFVIMVALGISSILYTYFLSDYTDKLEIQLKDKQELLDFSLKNDSLYLEELKKSNDSIKKYVNNCNFTVNGKSISSQELVKLVNKAMSKSNNLEDSLYIYKTKYKMAENAYGIKVYAVNVDNKFVFHKKLSKADSALALFPFFKDRIISYGSGSISIKTDPIENE